MLTSKDSLTGLLNHQAFYSTIDNEVKNITGIISIDMLKKSDEMMYEDKADRYAKLNQNK